MPEVWRLGWASAGATAADGKQHCSGAQAMGVESVWQQEQQWFCPLHVCGFHIRLVLKSLAEHVEMRFLVWSQEQGTLLPHSLPYEGTGAGKDVLKG